MKKTYKPILFSTPMVQAILAGRKTQTRRICKYQRNENGKYELTVNNEISELDYNMEGNDGNPFIAEKHQIGDILWVRETFASIEIWDEQQQKFEYQYRADGADIFADWKPSIHMPKEAARIFLEVTNVRCERLHDITKEDAIAEGIKSKKMQASDSTSDVIDFFTDYSIKKENYSIADRSFFEYQNNSAAVHCFVTLWESINGKDSWKTNPWVWVYEFKKVEKPTVWPQ